MSSNPAGAGGANQNSGGASDDPKNTNQNDGGGAGPGEGEKGKTVSYESFQKLLDEKKKAQSKLDELEREKKKREEAALAEQGEYKKLLEQREKELEDERAKSKKLETSIQESRKLNAFLGKVAGDVPKQYWGLIDLDGIAVDPATGIPDEASVAKAAKQFEKEYAEVIKRPNGGKLPNDAAAGAGSKLTYADWLKLPDDKKAERMKDVDKSTL